MDLARDGRGGELAAQVLFVDVVEHGHKAAVLVHAWQRPPRDLQGLCEPLSELVEDQDDLVGQGHKGLAGMDVHLALADQTAHTLKVDLKECLVVHVQGLEGGRGLELVLEQPLVVVTNLKWEAGVCEILPCH